MTATTVASRFYLCVCVNLCVSDTNHLNFQLGECLCIGSISLGYSSSQSCTKSPESRLIQSQRIAASRVKNPKKKQRLEAWIIHAGSSHHFIWFSRNQKSSTSFRSKLFIPSTANHKGLAGCWLTSSSFPSPRRASE